MWAGYTLILVIDKVIFDTSKLFKEDEASVEPEFSQNRDLGLNTTGNAGPGMQSTIDGYKNPYDDTTGKADDQTGAYPTLDDGT